MSNTANPSSAQQVAKRTGVDYGRLLRGLRNNPNWTPEVAAQKIKEEKTARTNPRDFGLSAEEMVQTLLARYGRHVSCCSYKSPFDLLVDGKHRVEVKSAISHIKKSGPSWFFNIHRHGVLSEVSVDFYVLRLEQVPYSKAAIHLLLRAPVGTPTINVSFRSLLNRRSQQVSDFYAFAKGEFSKSEVAA